MLDCGRSCEKISGSLMFLSFLRGCLPGPSVGLGVAVVVCALWMRANNNAHLDLDRVIGWPN